MLSESATMVCLIPLGAPGLLLRWSRTAGAEGEVLASVAEPRPYPALCPQPSLAVVDEVTAPYTNSPADLTLTPESPDRGAQAPELSE